MTPFSYRATTSEGRIVEGVMEADGEAAVIANLRSQGYIPLAVQAGRIKEKGKGFSLTLPDLPSLTRSRVKSRDIMLFTRELATLLRAGMPLDRSLQSLAQLTDNETLREIVNDVLSQVQGGKSLSKALAEHAPLFDTLYINMIRAGEAGGVMESVLERLADYLERSEQARDEIRGAMAYPIVLFVVGMLAIVVLLTYVLPKFTVLFADMGQALPLTTRLVMSASDALQAYWWAIAAAVFLAWTAFKRYTATPAGRYKFDRFRLGVPLFGGLTRKVQVARFARTLGTMLKSGVPMLQSLDIVRAVVTNVVIAGALQSVQKDVSEGKGLSQPLEHSGVFPALALQMVSVGEETGRLDDMLLIVADHFDREVTNTVNALMRMLEPAMLLFMGVVAGFIVISMLSAVFAVNDMTF